LTRTKTALAQATATAAEALQVTNTAQLICVYDPAGNVIETQEEVSSDSPTEELLCKSLCKNEGISAHPLIFRRNRAFGPFTQLWCAGFDMWRKALKLLKPQF
jgi:hypothetical protein